jgi:hypothetical protein
MRTNSLCLAVLCLALASLSTGKAQPYSNAVVALSPVGYWPLNETTAPPSPLNITARNLGTLGASGNGYYGAWYQPSGNTWYLTNNIIQSNAVTFPFDASKSLWCQAGPGQYVVVPRTLNGAANSGVTLNPPFTIEVWLRQGRQGLTNVLGTIVSQGGFVNLNTGGSDPANPFYGGLGTGWAGVELGQYQDYLFLICNATNGQSKANELDTSAYNSGLGFHIGDVIYVVATFDGSVETIFTNGALCVSKNIAANGAGLKYVADPTTPLMIGSGSDVSASYGNAWAGGISDVAIYTNVLSELSILNHYEAAFGTNGTFGADYTNAVLADSPALYLRLNDPQSVTNAGYPSGTFPVAANYGSAGAGAAGVYQPGTTPGLAGPTYGGFGAGSKSVGINGFLGAVDVGSSNLPVSLNPTGYVALTVAAWFKGGPADAPGRFQEIVGHGDSSYRLALGQIAGENHFNPGPGPELQFASPADVATNGFAFNDGKWHMAVGVSDGTNEFLYLDGVLAKSATTSGINIVGSPADLLLGGDRQYTFASPNTPNTIRNFDGQIAQVAFWTNALSAAQIQQLFGAAQVPPSITQQPQSATNNAGTVAALTVGARGSATLNYQWYKSSAKVTGATSSSLVFNPVTQANAGNYFVTVTNAGGSLTSSVATLTVLGAPFLVEQSPTTIQVFRGTSPTLRVSVLGSSPAYQWSLNSSPIAGATSSSYTAAHIQSSGTYACTITNSFGSTPSAAISVAVLTPPAASYPTAVLADNPIAYFRLDETSGTTAFDYTGGMNASYTNASLGQPGYSTNDPTELAAQFGSVQPVDSFAGHVIDYLNFAAPSGGSSAFSIEAWANGSFGQSLDAGIVALGYGNGGEQFDLDTGGSFPSHNFRFIVRDASGTAHVIDGTVGPHDGNWHHLVGVCDQPNGSLKLYVDGVLNNSTTIGANAGILLWTSPLSIGSRQSGSGTPYDDQFMGSIDDVSVYNYALSANQVLTHFYGSGVAPFITQQPTNTTVNEGSTAQFSVTALGTPPLSYQWFDAGTGTPIAGASTSVLTLSNVTVAMSGNSYDVVVSNLYGSVQSAVASLAVQGGSPLITSDPSPPFEISYAGTPFTYSVAASGTAPLHYQWLRSGVPITGATNSNYSFASIVGTNLFAAVVTNRFGSATSAAATNVGIAGPTLNPADYAYKMKITFAGYNRAETLANFPALIQFGTNLTSFSYAQFASPTGGDLRFTDASGTRQIPHEIDDWNPSGTSAVWVQVPRLTDTNTAIWAYWGNPAATTPLSWSTNGETWVPAFGSSPPYEVVYHLKEGAFPFADGTTLHPATNGVAPGLATGVVGRAAAFNGSAWLDTGTNDVGDFFTLSAWVNVPTIGNIQTLWANQHGGYGAPGFALSVNTYNNTDGKLDFASGNGAGGGNESTTAAGAVSFGQWHLVEVAINHTNRTAEFYVDGSDIFSSSSIIGDFTTLADLRLGIFVDNAFAFHGTMDEARIRQTTNSANWVWADYMTVAQNSALESYSPVASSAVILTFQVSGGNLILSWPTGTLQSASQVTGTYANVNGALSPYSPPLNAAPMKYYRVRVH